jgi:uncharacterized protein YaiI (UPF0178 family)
MGGGKQKKEETKEFFSKFPPRLLKYPWSWCEGLCYTFFVKIYLDADGAPWRDLVIERAIRHGVTVVVVADYSHALASGQGVERVLVDNGRDAADFAIINRVAEGDLVITQDVGLASLVLPKGVAVISPRGYEFRADAIERQLAQRWASQRIRRGGGRTHGPKALSTDDRTRFLALLEQRLTTLVRRLDEDRSIPG